MTDSIFRPLFLWPHDALPLRSARVGKG
jgi:hypothetical protein